jgi:peptidoglycan/LPS O-acetylase OafA/YrhL
MHLLVWVKYGKFDIGFWVYSLVYLVILMNVALNPRSLLKLENRFFRFMGEISYGFYVFHWLVLVVCINSFVALGGIQHEFLRSVVLLLSTFGLTTILAAFSFLHWERRFLRRKPGGTALTSEMKPEPALS